MDPILIESMMWIMLILSTPVIWWVFRVLGEGLGRLFFPGKLIELRIVDGKDVKQLRFLADNDDELVKTLLEIQRSVFSKVDASHQSDHLFNDSNALMFSRMKVSKFDKKTKKLELFDIPAFLRKQPKDEDVE